MPDASKILAVRIRAAEEFGGLLRLREGMEIDDAINGVIVCLHGYPVAEGTHVVADMNVAVRLNAREDSLFRHDCSPWLGFVEWAVFESKKKSGAKPDGERVGGEARGIRVWATTTSESACFASPRGYHG